MLAQLRGLAAGTWIVICVLLLGLASRVFAAGAVPLVDDSFAGASASAWTVDSRGGSRKSLTFPAAGDAAGLRFTSQGLDILTRECPVGVKPFEMAADLEITSGIPSAWRNNGVVLAPSSAPVDKMGATDWAVVFSPVQQGILATVKQGGARYPTEKRPGALAFPGADITPRLRLSMGGGGGLDYSIAWPTKTLAGTKLRFHIWRDGENTLRLTVFNADGAAGPWWEAQATLPKALQGMGLRYLTIHTSREDYAFAAPEAAVPAGATLSGTITHLAVRELAEKEAPQLCVSFPAAVLATKARGPEARSMMFPPAGGLEALRKKFNAPEFADYKSVLLHNTVPGVIDTPVTPSPCERLTSLFWAYVLTDQREYYDRMLVEVDGLCGVTDKLPANRWEMPGHLRQVLDIQEFMGHNIAALAMVYDVLGDQLDQARRDRIHFVLVRAAKQYLQRIATGDWWYVSNPSNTIGVGSGTMGLAGLALRYDDPELSKKVLDAAVTTITKQYVALSADGSCIEGNLYWDYGTRYPLLLGYALRNVTGSDRGITSGNGYKNAQHYMENILGGDGKFIPFNDTQPWLTGWGMCSYAGSQFDQPFMRWMADRMAKYYAARTEFEGGATPTISAFLYRDTRLAPKDFPGVPTISVLKGVQEGVMRSDGKVFIPALVTGVKGKGASSTHHAEEDQGSFVVYSNGEPMLIDPGYFESDAQMHSLPLLGDAAKMKLETTVECPIMDAWESGVIRTMSVDATAAYNAGPNAKTPLAERVRRVVVQVGASGVVVLDDIAPKDPKAAVTSQYQTGFAATVQGERNALITGKSGTLTLRTFGPDLKLAVAPRKFSKEWIYFKANVVWQTLSGSYIVDADKPLVTVLVPALKDAAPVAASVQYTADHVDVTIGENKVRFQREAGPGSSKSVWKALKP